MELEPILLVIHDYQWECLYVSEHPRQYLSSSSFVALAAFRMWRPRLKKPSVGLPLRARHRSMDMSVMI